MTIIYNAGLPFYLMILFLLETRTFDIQQSVMYAIIWTYAIYSTVFLVAFTRDMAL